MDKKFKKAVAWAIIILLAAQIPFFLYLMNFRLAVFNTGMHEEAFLKLNVYSRLPGMDINSINRNVVDYLSNKDIMHRDFLNERELQHLEDVKNIVQLAISILYFLIFSFLILFSLLYTAFMDKKIFIKNLGLALIFGSVLALSISAVFFFAAYVDFSGFFDRFHGLFFELGTWTFDAGTENIVNLYPEQFFYDLGYKIWMNSFIASLVLLIIGIILYRKNRI